MRNNGNSNNLILTFALLIVLTLLVLPNESSKNEIFTKETQNKTETQEKSSDENTNKENSSTQNMLEEKISSTKETTSTTTKIETSTEQNENENISNDSSLAGKQKAIDVNKINERTRSVVINILCTTKSGGDFNPISGSGVVVDPRGVILTNAHVAQYLLLRDYGTKNFISCIGRTGSPASPSYNLDLLYLPKSWIENNFKNIALENPLGTGEDDYALLYVTGPVDGKTLPTTFDFIDIDESDQIALGMPILTAGYPAGFLGGITIQTNLYLTSSVSEIKKLYYFKDNTSIDLFSLGGNILAQKGASGGAAVNELNEKLLGIITTTTAANNTGERDLMAITMAHINKSLQKHEGIDLKTKLSGNISEQAASFKENQFPYLKSILENELNQKNN